jgi:alcohol dehydrogenase (cytochrome c)
MVRAEVVAILSGLVGLATGVVAFAAPAPSGTDTEWTMPSRDYAATRYSSLASITTQNARGLHPVWTFSTGVLGGHEGQPLVVGNTMYVVTPWPNVLYAFDLTREGYPLKWKYRPAVSANAIGVACCDSVNRGSTDTPSRSMPTRGASCGIRRSRTSRAGRP